MTLAIYPGSQANSTAAVFGQPTLAFSVKWSPVFFNQSVKTMNGASIDIGLALTPLHSFELTYNGLRDYPITPNVFPDTEFRQMMGFWLQIGGALGRFAFVNPDDFTVTQQAIATSDGTTTDWPIVRTFGVDSSLGSFSGTENVGLVYGTVTTQVFFNGVLQTAGTNYSINSTTPGNQLLHLITVPGAGVAITMTFSYAYYCKFQDDTVTFEKWVNQVWSEQSVKIQSCRANA